MSRTYAAFLNVDERQVIDYIGQRATEPLTRKVLAVRPELADAIAPRRHASTCSSTSSVNFGVPAHGSACHGA
jgi:hypothetical protein